MGKPAVLAYELTIAVGLNELTLMICECQTAPRQLISLGLFPCAPCSPSLAIDVSVLRFVSLLFVNMPPNSSAWCETVETFLSERCYSFQSKVQIIFINFQFLE